MVTAWILFEMIDPSDSDLSSGLKPPGSCFALRERTWYVRPDKHIDKP